MSEVFSFPAGKIHLHGNLRRDRQDHLQQARPAAHGVNAAAEVGNHGRGATVLVDSQSISSFQRFNLLSLSLASFWKETTDTGTAHKGRNKCYDICREKGFYSPDIFSSVYVCNVEYPQHLWAFPLYLSVAETLMMRKTRTIAARPVHSPLINSIY